MTPLQSYLLDIRQTIGRWAGIRVEHYREQLLTATRGNLRVRLCVADDSLLEISEALVVHEGELTWLSYRYHWQDVAGRLIFRYDDAPHYPEIETFPHHWHVGEMVIASDRLDLPGLIEEIQRMLSSGGEIFRAEGEESDGHRATSARDVAACWAGGGVEA